MSRRGDKLRDHILWSAKEVFLEEGFERASMDAVAARAETSKRSLYAHFETKEKLFLEVFELTRGLFFDRLKLPSDYPGEPEQALTQFCARYMDVLLYEGSIRMCRVALAEADRFPEAGARYFETLFSEVQVRLSNYLKVTLRLTPRVAQDSALKMLQALTHPRFARVLFGAEPVVRKLGEEAVFADAELKQARKVVTEVLASLG